MRVFVRVWAGFGLLLFASTWKLWTPQTEFPQIPFFEWLVDIPGWVDWIAFALVVAGLVTCLLAHKRSIVDCSLWIFVAAASLLILLNQHRLQPWAYQYVVFAIILATAKPKSGVFWMRWIVISIYVYSAISKFDYQFAHTVGDQMLASITGKIGVDSSTWPAQIRQWIVLTFPMAELLIGLGLVIPRTRRFGMLAAIALHVALLVALLGNVQGAGVLIWNAFFIAQVVLLFGWKTEPEETLDSTKRFPLNSAATLVAVFVLLFPLTQPFGICDHWPAWQVYAPRTSRAEIDDTFINESPVWSDVSSWSRDTLQVPVYPQTRFQLAVAMAAQERFPESSDLPITVSGESDRWTGTRETKALTGDQVQMHAQRYWLNMKPRSLWLLGKAMRSYSN